MPDLNSELAELMPEATTMPRQGVGINVKRLVKLRGRLMVMVFLGLGVPLFLAVWLFVPREYAASAQLEFKGIAPRIMGEGTRILSGPTYESYVNTQVKLVTGPAILRRVLEDEAIRGLSFASSPDPLQHLFNHIKAEADQNTELVTIEYSDVNRDHALLVLNTILNTYIQYTADQETNQGGIKRTTLIKKETELREDLDTQQKEITNLRKELGVAVGETPGAEPTETESFVTNLATAEADHTKADSEMRKAQRQVERLHELIEAHRKNPSTPIYALGIEDRVLLNPHVGLLLEQMAEVDREYAVMRERYMDGVSQLDTAKAERDSVAGELAQVKASARGEALRTLLAEHEYQVTISEADMQDALDRKEQFQGLLDNYKTDNVELSQGLAELAERERRYEETREYLLNLNNNLLNLEIESNAPARVNPLGEATAPSTPDMTRRLKILLLVFMVVIGLSVLVGVAFELTDQNIRSAEDVAYVTNWPIISVIPHSSEDRLPEQVSTPTITEKYPNSLTADEFRRTAAKVLNASGSGRQTKTCVVASPVRGDGKTTLACNLAIVLAQADKRVLLLDADSRNPSIESAFGLRPGPGLSEMLSGEQLTHDPDRETEFENLFVLGPGLRSRDLVERLASEEMRDFLEGAEDLFDHIIIDTPATLLTSEARLLMPLVDGVVVVVGAGNASFGVLRRCLRSLEQFGAPVIGVVLNAVKHSPGGYLRHNVDQYYSHGGGHQREGMRVGRSGASRMAEPSIILVDGKGKGGSDDDN